MLYSRLSRNTEAETLLREVVKANPELPDVQYSLGLLLVEQKKNAEAALRRAVELEPASMDYLQILAQLYLKQGDFADASRIADQMIARHPGDSRGLALKDFVQQKTAR